MRVIDNSIATVSVKKEGHHDEVPFSWLSKGKQIRRR